MRRLATILGLGALLVAAVAYAAPSEFTFGTATVQKEYTRHFSIDAASLILGPSAPDSVTIGTFRGIGLNANAETVSFNWHVPATAWTGTSDVDVIFHFFSDASTAIAVDETVIIDCDYTTLAAGDDGPGTSENITVTYTEVGGDDTAGQFYEVMLTMDFDVVGNVLSPGDTVGFICFRDATADTYGASNINVVHIGVEYKSRSIGAD